MIEFEKKIRHNVATNPACADQLVEIFTQTRLAITALAAEAISNPTPRVRFVSTVDQALIELAEISAVELK